MRKLRHGEIKALHDMALDHLSNFIFPSHTVICMFKKLFKLGFHIRAFAQSGSSAWPLYSLTVTCLLLPHHIGLSSHVTVLERPVPSAALGHTTMLFLHWEKDSFLGDRFLSWEIDSLSPMPPPERKLQRSELVAEL